MNFFEICAPPSSSPPPPPPPPPTPHHLQAVPTPDGIPVNSAGVCTTPHSSQSLEDHKECRPTLRGCQEHSWTLHPDTTTPHPTS